MNLSGRRHAELRAKGQPDRLIPQHACLPPRPRAVKEGFMTGRTSVFAALFVGASILIAGRGDWNRSAQADSLVGQQAAAQEKQATQRTPPYYESLEDVREIPKTLSPEKFDDPTRKQAYQIAQDDPKLLMQLPCYCPCDDPQVGHKSLLDCFVDKHAAGCGICTSEALRAARLKKEGVSIQDIRLKLAADYLKGH